MTAHAVKVILIGGAPGAGKTTLGSALARRLGFTSLSIDDLMTAAQAVTTPESHPGLHAMRMRPYLDYFTNSRVEQLKADADAQHEAMWPVIEPVIRRHASWGTGIVMDGWHLRPARVARLGLETVSPLWLVALPSVLEARERGNLDWLQGSPDPKRMLENFLTRSLWYNTLIREEAGRREMTVLTQSGSRSVDELCDLAMAALPR